MPYIYTYIHTHCITKKPMRLLFANKNQPISYFFNHGIAYCTYSQVKQEFHKFLHRILLLYIRISMVVYERVTLLKL